ncbi:GNAT family N-acetyltransferase [Companilactobacillus kimchiensis]|uniref:Transcriptional regulator n=1 Tax=Companilactobacillus kimchiensis TaxID=993692 RepID=A0A0R2LGU7_9LACO|nr:GNAT family N-acetyltransferase [Companilactobacillus kimchiensis]KRN99045.1 transcriptional regulator [Companilactobacillus kimchiensis]
MNYQITKTDQNYNFDAVRTVYYQTWNYSYRGLVPQVFLDNIDPKTTWHPETRWDNTLIAVTSDGQTIGVCTYGPARRKKYAGFGEIYSLYVLPKWHHQGIGQKLFQAALDILQQHFTDIYLIVLKANLAAQAFYELFGFTATTDLLADQTSYGILHEVVYIKK